jgi:type IV pilus assembly protein PilC
MATATFEYKVRDRAGKLKTGTLAAETQSQVASKLKGMGYAPLSIVEKNAGLDKELTIPGWARRRSSSRTSPSSRGSSPR